MSLVINRHIGPNYSQELKNALYQRASSKKQTNNTNLKQIIIHVIPVMAAG